MVLRVKSKNTISKKMFFKLLRPFFIKEFQNINILFIPIDKKSNQSNTFHEFP